MKVIGRLVNLSRYLNYLFVSTLCVLTSDPLQKIELVFHVNPDNGDSILLFLDNHRDIILSGSDGEWVMLAPPQVNLSLINGTVSLPSSIMHLDYTIPPSVHTFSTDRMKWLLFNHMFVVMMPQLTFAYLVDVTYEKLSMLQELGLSIDAVKLSCVDETLVHHPIFGQFINAIIINACPVTAEVLEILYVLMVDLYIVRKDMLLYLHSHQGVLEAIELPFENRG